LMDVIEHLPDDGGVLRAVARCQQPGDRLFVSTQNRLSLNYLLEGTYHKRWLREEDWCGWDPTHLRFYTPGSLRRRLAQAGYRPTRWWGMFIVPYNILSWLVLLRRNLHWSCLHRPDLLRGAGAVATVKLQGALDLLALHFGKRLRGVTSVAPAPAPPDLAQVRWQVLDPDLRRPARQDHAALEHVAHLAHVARPRRRQQAIERLGAAGIRTPGHLRPEVLQDPGEEREAILA